MDQKEWESWLAVTTSSTHKWVEDSIFRLNGRGVMYYTGGKDGVYMQISKDGILEIGIYEGALPHIGEAFFCVMREEKCSDFNEAFQMACQIGGKKFLMDLFSTDQVPQDLIENDSIQKDDFSMYM
ncbi:hypothetical protein [Lacrimispora sp.]|uniref:hypothetical protein n=1 Tax=Lacrimispora sp. TaxID=2719234 RepID=UPI0028AFF4A4|nr:hypothetical protein [Lacrimispora sp.]